MSERLVKVRILFKKKWTTFIQVYAPTEDSEKEEKDRFYASLESVLVKVKKDDRLVLMGDLNGRVGRDVETWEEVIGRHGEDTQNDNGRRLLGTCATNGMTIMNGCFEHKDIHKYTWECRGRGLRTIIDYFAVRKALRQTVADVKVIRGAEAGSDHYLVLMKLNLRWTRRKKEVRNEGSRLRLRKLLDWGERVRFQTELGKLFEKLYVCIHTNNPFHVSFTVSLTVSSLLRTFFTANSLLMTESTSPSNTSASILATSFSDERMVGSRGFSTLRPLTSFWNLK